MNSNTAAAQNLIIGRTSKVVHLPHGLLTNDPLCGGVLSGKAQARRRTDRPATCKRCLAKATETL